ncbi:aminoglycoside phosphotransferase family protein [Streptomyces sp. AK02-01A]|uniref:phosphotransferase family protein n=1 Tax=Streptomyces sp. AK02-01A TaxID=3028648 RepID=UPI0029B1BD1B|nr:aminoglycoside phosphotransferase family protein [Streptomyces sp. AK02-01A]MDX3850667.1 aminoglycoside phosphotransferase family protein [Streptomyces sp. AK02-01A]
MPTSDASWGTPAPLPSHTGSRRISWSSLPRSVAAGIEGLLQGAVTTAISQQGGFSDGLAVRLELSDGRKAFAKAVDTVAAPAVGEFHRREIAVAGGLPSGVPAPRLLGSFDDGEWVALVFEDIDGALPAQPWREAELRRVLDAVTDLAEGLTPAPPRDLAYPAPRLGGWRRLADNPRALRKLTEISPRTADELEAHLSLEAHLAEATAGETLTHGDLYPFNILLTADRVVVVDWPHAWAGPRHADLVMLLGSVALSGIDPEPFAARHPLLTGVERDAVDVLISAQAGFLLAAACSMDSTGDPRLARMMTGLGLASLRWLSVRHDGTGAGRGGAPAGGR